MPRPRGAGEAPAGYRDRAGSAGSTGPRGDDVRGLLAEAAHLPVDGGSSLTRRRAGIVSTIHPGRDIRDPHDNQDEDARIVSNDQSSNNFICGHFEQTSVIRQSSGRTQKQQPPRRAPDLPVRPTGTVQSGGRIVEFNPRVSRARRSAPVFVWAVTGYAERTAVCGVRGGCRCTSHTRARARTTCDSTSRPVEP